MSTTFTINFIDPLNKQASEDLEASIGELQGVDKAQGVTDRFDPAVALMWIEIAGGAAGIGAGLVTIVTGIKALFKKKQVMNATVTLPDGTEIELDNSSVEDITTIIEAIQDDD
jgi:hypothetical protein